MRWPPVLKRISAAIEADSDGIEILGAAAAQAVYLEGTRQYQVPSLDFFLVGASKEEVTEPARVQFNGHAKTFADLVMIGNMLERLFDRDTWHTLGDIYMRSEKVDDGRPDGPDSDGRFHQWWDYEFEPVRSKYVNEVVES